MVSDGSSLVEMVVFCCPEVGDFLIAEKDCATTSRRLMIEFMMMLVREVKAEGTSFVTMNSLVYLKVRKALSLSSIRHTSCVLRVSLSIA